jgi:hypothetical protein
MAEMLNISEPMARRWEASGNHVPAPVAVWIRRIAKVVADNPPPRAPYPPPATRPLA